jgi:hypothetical protein
MLGLSSSADIWLLPKSTIYLRALSPLFGKLFMDGEKRPFLSNSLHPRKEKGRLTRA